MSDEIKNTSRGSRESSVEAMPTRRLVPMRVGSATVYIEQIGEGPAIEADASIYSVAPNPKEAFEIATEVLRECVHTIGEQFEKLEKLIKPQEVSVEFTLTFDVKGKVSPIPVLVTGEVNTQTGLKVNAIWRRSEVEKS